MGKLGNHSPRLFLHVFFYPLFLKSSTDGNYANSWGSFIVSSLHYPYFFCFPNRYTTYISLCCKWVYFLLPLYPENGETLSFIAMLLGGYFSQLYSFFSPFALTKLKQWSGLHSTASFHGNYYAALERKNMIWLREKSSATCLPQIISITVTLGISINKIAITLLRSEHLLPFFKQWKNTDLFFI